MIRSWNINWRKRSDSNGASPSTGGIEGDAKDQGDTAPRKRLERIVAELSSLSEETRTLRYEIMRLYEKRRDTATTTALKNCLIRARDIRYKSSFLQEELDRIYEKTNQKPPQNPGDCDREKPPPEVLEMTRILREDTIFSNLREMTFFEKTLEDFTSVRTNDRLDAIKTLRSLRTPGISSLFKAGLGFENDRVQAACLLALSDLNEPCEENELAGYLNASSHRLRVAVLRCLFNHASPNTKLACLCSLADTHAEVRKTAAEFLGLLESTDATWALTTLLKDEVVEVRIVAANSLGMIAPEQGVLALIRALTDDNESVRRASKAALCRALSVTLEIDVAQDPKVLAPKVEALISWWVEARIKGPPWIDPLSQNRVNGSTRSRIPSEKLPRIGYVPVREQREVLTEK